MKKIPVLLFLLCAGLLFAGCRSKPSAPPSEKFMEHDPARGSGNISFGGVIEKERDRKEARRREFQDVRRPMNQESFKVYPWHNSGDPRSEGLHEKSRSGTNSVF